MGAVGDPTLLKENSSFARKHPGEAKVSEQRLVIADLCTLVKAQFDVALHKKRSEIRVTELLTKAKTLERKGDLLSDEESSSDDADDSQENLGEGQRMRAQTISGW